MLAFTGRVVSEERFDRILINALPAADIPPMMSQTSLLLCQLCLQRNASILSLRHCCHSFGMYVAVTMEYRK